MDVSNEGTRGTRTFDPWKGGKYSADPFAGVRLLILGLSHYGVAGTETRTFTIDVVRKWGQQQRSRFFTMAQVLVSGFPMGQRVPDQKRAEFWDQVAFYNYIQSFAGSEPRIHPTDAMWAAAVRPFLTTLEELDPHVIVPLGLELYDRLPRAQVPKSIRIVRCQHPSGAGFRYEPWRSSIREALQEVGGRPGE